MNHEASTPRGHTNKGLHIGWIVAWSIGISVLLALLALPTLSALVAPLVVMGGVGVSGPVMIVGIIVLSRVNLGIPLVLTSIFAGCATVAFSTLNYNALHVLFFEMGALSTGLWVFSRISPTVAGSGSCVACGYSIAGLASGSVCPECGNSNDIKADLPGAIRIAQVSVYITLCSLIILWSFVVEFKSHSTSGLIQRLGSSDMQVRWEAADKLSRRDPSRLINEAYLSTNPNQRRGAILGIVLGVNNKSFDLHDAVDVLFKVLTSDQDKWVRLEAATRLKGFVQDAADQVLYRLRIYSDSDPQVNAVVRQLRAEAARYLVP